MGIVTDDTSMIVWKRAIDVGLMWRETLPLDGALPSTAFSYNLPLRLQ
jgi:hypothetical protein